MHCIRKESYLNTAFMLAGLGEVIGCLQPQPMVGVRPPSFFKADRHICGNSSVSIEDTRERVSRNAKRLGCLSHSETQRLKAAIFNRVAGVRRIFHGHILVLLSSRSIHTLRHQVIAHCHENGGNIAQPGIPFFGKGFL